MTNSSLNSARITVSHKILAMTLLLIFLTAGSLIFLSRKMFLEYQIKKDQALTSYLTKIFAVQMQQSLDRVFNKTQIILRSQTHSTEPIFDEEIFSITLYSLSDGKILAPDKKLNPSLIQKYSLSLDFFEKLHQEKRTKWETAFSGEVNVSNTTISGYVPILTLSFPLEVGSPSKPGRIAVVDFKMDTIQSSYSASREKILFAVDREGHLISHQDERLALSGMNTSYLPVVTQALNASQNSGSIEFTSGNNGERYLASYSKTSWGVTVVALDSIEPFYKFINRSTIKLWIVFGGIFSFSIFVVFLFGERLLKPINYLRETFLEATNEKRTPTVQSFSNDEFGDLIVTISKFFESIKHQ